MPLFSELCSDSPLHLTLLERPYAGALTQSYRAGVTSVRGIHVPLIGSAWWFLSRILVDRIFDAQHYSGTNGRHCHSVEPRICTGSRTNFWSSMCAPSAGGSACGLTQVRASVREFRLHIDEQRTPLVERGRAHLRGNAELFSRALPTRSLSSISGMCDCRGPHAVHIGTSLTDKHSSLSDSPDEELDRRSAPGLPSWRACSRTTEQLRSLRRSTQCLKAEEQ
jgi:hypothetical protein